MDTADPPLLPSAALPALLSLDALAAQAIAYLRATRAGSTQAA